jgi:polyhydroxyalkanoate synthesis regulator phasin
MESKYISIKDVVARYEISTSKARKIVNEYKHTANVQTSKINGRHGFKYQISIEFLDELLKVAPDKQAPNKAEKFDNTLVNQLQATNNQLSNQIDTQNDIIKNLTTTLQEQQKVVVAQSLQISRLSERTTTEPQWNNPSDQGPTTTKKTTTIELLIIVVLLICIVAAIAYLFISIVN